MIIEPFFERLREIDSRLRDADEYDASVAVSLAPHVKEQASALRLIERLNDDVSSGNLAFRVSLMVGIPDPAERRLVADTLVTEAIRRSLGVGAGPVPTPTTPRQLRTVIKHATAEGAELDSRVLTLLSVGLRGHEVSHATSPDQFAKIVSRVCQELGFGAAEGLLVASGLRADEELNRTQGWWVSELLKGCIGSICEVDPESATRFFRELLEGVLTKEPAIDRTSTIWLPRLELRSADSLREVAVMGLKKAVEHLLEATDLGAGMVLGLWGSSWVLLRRVALGVSAGGIDSDDLDAFADLAVVELTTDEVPYDLEVEFRDLLQSRFHRLSTDARSAVFEWLDRGLGDSRLPDDLPIRERRALHDRWVLDWLTVIESHLVGEWRARYEALSNEISPTAHRWDRGVRTGFVSQESPVTTDEMRGWDPQELPTRLAGALDDTNKAQVKLGGGFSEVSREGLVRAVAELLPEVAARWLPEFEPIVATSREAGLVLVAAVERWVRGDPEWHDAFGVQQLLDSGLASLGDDVDALRSLAQIAEAASPHWIEDDPVSSLSTLQELVSIALSHPEPGMDDPSVAAINTPAGISAGLACYAHLRLIESERIEESLDTSRQILSAAAGAGRRDIHAAVGRWFSLLLVHDQEWSSEHQGALFPPNETLFDAAWGGHVRFGRLRQGIFRDLADEYQRAVRDLSTVDDETYESAETYRSLVEHLMVLAAWGELAVSEGLIGEFFISAPEPARRYAHSFLAREASTPELSEDALARMQQVVAGRIPAVADSSELAEIGQWCEAPVSDEWLLPLLLDAAKRTARFTDADTIVTWLGRLRGRHVVDALPLLAQLCRAAEPWELGDWSDEVRKILSSALEQDRESARLAADIADEAGSRGLVALSDVYWEAVRLLRTAAPPS